ncbi:Glyoxalase/Bleomycin resistance protein/Dihydroxybiphenyl dioxygenase [Xylariales sp. AK1849]|nr:Glyoxalase/Bleomycin resistance protein/Dihydroxybiphenyl dioxygenase [Xylariales sp. AK1849]
MTSQDETATSNKVLSPASLAHIVLRTANFKSMVAFYKAFLGAHASYENDVLSFLTYDEEHHRIAVASVAGTIPKVSAASGMDHVAFTFSSVSDLALAYQQRKARGILPVWSINHGPTTSMYYQDPDGNRVETQVDNFDTVDEAIAYFTCSEFLENPIGVDFDPEDLIRRLQSGEDDRDIKKRPNIGKRGLDSIPPPSEPVVRENSRENYEPIVGAA